MHSPAPEPLYIVGYRDRFDHRPDQRRAAGRAVLDDLLARLDGRTGPDLANRYLMQGRDDIGRTGLPDIVERHRIVRPVPAPSLQHHRNFSTASRTRTLSNNGSGRGQHDLDAL